MKLTFGEGKTTIAYSENLKSLGFIKEKESREIGPCGIIRDFNPDEFDVVLEFLNIEGARALQDRINGVVVDLQRKIDLEKMEALMEK
jgi:hypothetical protein